MTKYNTKKEYKPFVSICTPTFNRRPFIPTIIQCFQHQTYPKSRMEWIVIDDGTDKVGELFSSIQQVKYFSYDQKMRLGQKRNLMHEKCKGEIIVYMDDDDYYPPCRVEHAVEMLLKNPTVLCAGSSIMFMYFKNLQKMVQCGPYGPNHSTAATFAFRRNLLKTTRYDDLAIVSEEIQFLKNYTIPLIQLDPLKCILVFSHKHNSLDKQFILKNNPSICESSKKVEDFVKEPIIRNFFLNTIDECLTNYNAGNPENKPDVFEKFEEIKKEREIKQQAYQDAFEGKLAQKMQKEFNNLQIENQLLYAENNSLKEKIIYLENKIKILVQTHADKLGKN